MISMIRRSPLRSKLALTTALAGGVLGFGGTAFAQTPATPNVTQGVGVGFRDDGTPIAIGDVDGTIDNLEVRLGLNRNTIIEWGSFDVGGTQSVDFNSSLGGLSAAVVNRVTGPTMSNIDGSITSSGNVAVWLINGNGIAIGGGANISTGSFVASVLNVDDSQFPLAGGGNTYDLTTGLANSAAITIAAGAEITAATGNRGLVLVAPVITANGDFDAGDRDVAFVTATDVQLSYDSGGGPLSVRIDAGTSMPAGQVVQGTVAGRSVFFAMATQTGVVDALLNVGAVVTATSAAADDTGIVLSGGRTVTGSVTVAANADTAGAVDIASTSSLTTTGQSGEIRAIGNDAIDIDGDIDASRAVLLESTGAVSANNIISQRGVTVLAGGAAAVSGNVTAADDYSVTGASVALGMDGDAETQRSNDAVTITSTAGAITGGAGLTLRSDHNGDGGDHLTLSSTGGDILFDAISSVEGGIARESDVQIRSDLATRVVQLGNLSAEALVGAVGAGGFSPGITRSADIRLGFVNLVDALSLTSSTGNITTGNIVVTGGNQDVSIEATAGAVSIDGITADGDVTVTAAGAAALTGAVTAGGNYAVTGGTVALGDDGDDEIQQADGTVVIQSTVGAITGGVGLTLRSAANGGAGDFLILDAATAINAAGAALNAGPSQVGLDAGSTITTGDITAALLGDANATNTGVDPTFNHGADTIFGDLTITATDLDIELTAGNLTTGNVDATNGSILMSAPGVLVAGDVVGEDSVTLRGGSVTAGDVTSTTQNVVVQSLAGNLSVGSLTAVTNSVNLSSTGGSISVSGNVTAGTDYLVNGDGDVTLGDDPGAELQQAGGQIQISAVGTLTGGSGLTLQSGTGDITLSTQGLVGGDIVFAADSLIQGGGTGVERDVVVLSRTLGNAVVLGDVSARSLLGEITGGPPPSNGITRDGSITVDQVNLVNTLALTSNMGNVSVGGVSVSGVGQGITLQAPTGTLTAPGALIASGSILLNGFNALTFGALTSTTGSVSATSSGGALTTGAVSGQTGVSLTANGNLSATSANAAAGSVTLTSTTGSATFGSLSASGDIGINAALAASITDNVTAGGNYIVNAGSVSLGGDPDAELQQAAGTIDIRAASGGITGGTGLTLRSDSNGAGGGDLFIDAATSIALGGATVQGGTAGTGRVGVRAGLLGSITLGNTIGLAVGETDAAHVLVDPITHTADVTFGNVTTVGTPFGITLAIGDITTGNVTATNIALTANAGTVTTGNLTSTTDITISASGAATLGTLLANQNVSVTGGSISGAGFTATNGALNLNATASGLTLGAVSAQAGVTLTALNDLTATSATSAAGAVSATSTGGNVTLGSASALTNVSVSAVGAADVTGNVTAGGNYSVTGATVSLGDDGDAEVQQAAGAVTVRATSGTLAGGTGLILRSDSDNAGGELLTLGLGAGSNLAFGPATIEGGTNRSSIIRIDYVDPAPSLVLGDVSGFGFQSFDGAVTSTNFLDGGAGTIATGDLDFSDSVIISTTGGLTTGAVNSDLSVSFSANGAMTVNGPVTAGAGVFLSGGTSLSLADSVTATGAVSLGSSGATTGTSVTAGTSASISGASVDFTSVTATSGALNATASAGDMSIGTASSGGAMTLRTLGGAGDVRVDTATAAGLLTINSVDAVRGDSVLRADLTSTGGAVAVTAAATGTVNLGTGLAATDFGVTGSAIDATTLTATGGALTLNAGAGGITLGSGSGLTATIGTTGAATIATGLNTTGNSSVSAASAALAPIVSTTGSVSVTTTGGDYTGFGGGRTDISAGTNITLTIAGNTLIGTLDAGGAISATAASLDATTIDAVGAVSTTTPGAIIVGTIQGSDITATGASIAIGTASSGGLLDLSATAGGLTLTTGAAAGLADIDATGSVLIDTLTAGSADITGGSINIGDVTAAATLDMTAIAGDLVIGTGTSGGQMTLAASNDILFTTLDSGADASLTAGGDILGDMLSAVGAASTNAGGSTDIGTLNATGIAITSAVIDIASISTPGSLALTSTTGNLTLGTGSAGTSATLSSAANLDITTSLTAGGLASATAVGNATIGAITSSGGDVVVTAVAVDIGTASANGLLDVSATGGDLLIGTGTAAGLADLDATGAIDIGTLGAGSATLDAGGAITLGSLTSGGTAALVAGGALDATNINATGAATTQSGGATTIGTLSGSSIASTGTSVAIGTATAGTTLAVTASAGDAAVNGTAGTTATIGASGDVLIGTGLSAGGATTITAGRDARLAQVTATGGALTVTATTGQVSGATAGTRANLTAGGAGNALTVTAGDTALLGTANGAGGVTVNADAIDATSVAASGGAIGLTATAGGVVLGTGSASGNAGLTATGAVGVGSLSAADIAINGASVTTTTLSSTGSTAVTTAGAAALGTTTAGSSVAVTANGITAGTTSAGTTLSLTSGGGITLATGTAGGNATFDAAGTASLGAVTAGAASTLRVRATDVAITGAQRAGTIELVNRTPATAMRLGDDTAAGGFALNNTEFGLLEANTLTLDGGNGAIEIGTLTFDADAGRTAVNVLTTGQIDIGGTVSGTGTGRLFRFGGDAGAGAQASTIRIVATSDAGGRLLFGTSDVELRGQRIVMGLEAGFLDAILGGTPLSPEAVASQFISNPNSALYNPAITGQFYTDKNVIVANSLTVRFSDYALFQNTEAPGSNGGAVLGGTPSSPVTPALTIDGANSAGADGFALFGTINGVSGSAASLLGPSVIVVNMVDLPNARVNGCLIGSGAGCLTSVVVQPVLNVFDSSRLDVLRAADDLSLPFDPVVGTNNEALFSGVSSVDTQVTGDECENPGAPECKASEEETVE
jgi:filamentous hemagglutinin family protein